MIFAEEVEGTMGVSMVPGRCTLPDLKDRDAVIAALLEEARGQKWDTNSYLLVVDDDTGTAVLATGVASGLLPELVDGMKSLLLNMSWMALYAEGYGTAYESTDVSFDRPLSKDEFRSMTFLFPDFTRMYAYNRSDEDKGEWDFIVDDEDVLNPAGPTGRALIQIRKEMSW